MISTHQTDWERKREDMADVCNQCHADAWVQNYYKQFDAYVELYNEKFARPAQKIMDALYAAKVLTPTRFDEPIEYTFYELWHHEGRRGRHGASMMGPDFVQWHGAYEVAKHFYSQLVPEAERLKPGITVPFLAGAEHAWRKGLTREQIQEQIEFYRKRYQ